MLSWGSALEGQLGLGGIEETFISAPRQVWRLRADFFKLLSKLSTFCRFSKYVGLSVVKEVGCGLRHTVLLLEDGKVLSCGSNEKGQLAQDKVTTRPGKLLVCDCHHFVVRLSCSGLISALDSIKIRHVACGNAHSLALDETGKIYAWGDGQYGQLGLGMATNEAKFIPRFGGDDL